ncbi:uncharacterized protein LOC111044938 [Nilaparvata lugens]|uniref:uncharacterized protein LOC111044938 n=1 Tax=Nilaparvata lugens TaxID=108931 RepID=UPI00193DC651|nr:uncharacterized protein LOC111044938 [Nilaparvata lugens]
MGNLLSGGANLNAGSVLDRVISQGSTEDECLLYRLANYRNGGELIDAYNVGGQTEVEKLIKEQFGVLMYKDGKGQVINRSEYLRWKFRDTKQVRLPIEASLSPHDPLAKWEDHDACWQMQYRGSLGETLLHVLIICDTKLHTRLARTLLKCFPNLAMDVVEGEEYLGASALHLAIAYFNNELVQELVEAGANVMQRAIGNFFLPRDQQRARPSRHTDYEGLAYLGEFPLAWAACCANESVYNLLLDSGAHPDHQDSFGNMILHMVVVCDKLDMFGYALRHPKLPASNGITNNEGLTPLTLACKLGRAEVFREMLELSAREFWRYSNITCSAYPLNALDTLLPDGRTNWNSALFIILNGTKEEHLDMLDGGIIQRLLEEKWKTFARVNQIRDPAKAIFLISNILILACIPFRLAGDILMEEAILVVALPGSWFFLMFFAGAVRLTGPFVTMVYSMITGDMLTFGIIYTIVLFGFSQTFFFVYKGFPGVKNTLYGTYPTTWMALFQITLGDYNYAELANTTYPSVAKIVFAIFMVFVPILLLNMLIAMMGNTYAHVIEQSEKEWMKQWAKIVVSLERAVPHEDCHNYLQEYSIKLGPGETPGTEQRAVMVIKSKSKTRAKQRKGALSNWKRVGKVTIKELKKRNMTGEQLRRIMWERASISTPVKAPKKVNPLLDVLIDSNAAEPTPAAADPAPSAFGGLTAALDMMAFTNDLDLGGTTFIATQNNPAAVQDPFRDLVLTAETKASDSELNALAEAAAKAVIIEAEAQAAEQRAALLRQISLEQNAVLQPSDSDGLGEGPLLGRGSQVRRVKSAHKRAQSANTLSSDRQRLFKSSRYGSSSSSSSSEWGRSSPVILRPRDLLNSPPPPPPPYSDLDESVECANTTTTTTTTTKARPRPKTAKANRVAPSADVPSRRGQSATTASDQPKKPESPPDPLEPWSTRGIANMNALLAWDQSDHDSL